MPKRVTVRSRLAPVGFTRFGINYHQGTRPIVFRMRCGRPFRCSDVESHQCAHDKLLGACDLTLHLPHHLATATDQPRASAFASSAFVLALPPSAPLPFYDGPLDLHAFRPALLPAAVGVHPITHAFLGVMTLGTLSPRCRLTGLVCSSWWRCLVDRILALSLPPSPFSPLLVYLPL